MTLMTRLAHSKDLDDITNMIHGLAAHHGDNAQTDRTQLVQDLLGPNPWYTTLVAEDGQGVIQGYAAMLPTGQLQFAARGMDVHHLFVRPQARGHGIGTCMLMSCLAHAKARGCTYISVGTDAENVDAGIFYEARGFMRRDTSGHRFSKRLDQPPI